MNAEKVVNNSSEIESQVLFNSIIEYLDETGQLKETLLDGTTHRTISDIMRNVSGKQFPIKISNRRNFKKIKDWWKYSKEFMQEGNRAIILSLGGKIAHFTVVDRITDRCLFLKDSSGSSSIKRAMCRLSPYLEEDKYVIYPAQCWYLGR